MSVSDRRGSLSGELTGAIGKVWTGAPSRKDAPDRVRAVCRREPETKSRRQTRDVRFPGLYTYQRKERDRAIYRATPDDPQAHAGQAATDQAGAPHAHARSRASNWRMAQIGRAGYFNYHAVPGNLESLAAFRNRTLGLWWRTLRRRSQKHRLSWTLMLT